VTARPARAQTPPDVPALARLLPLHLRLGRDGRILYAGRTLIRICPGAAEPGRSLRDIFAVHRPRLAPGRDDLTVHDGALLELSPRSTPDCLLQGEIVTLAGGQEVLIGLSLGLGVVEAVARHRLTARDFAAADPTVEMLYLIEAQTLIREELRRLATRLAEARRAAEMQALTDTLTGLGNRRAMEGAAERLSVPDGAEHFALLHVDLDHFKSVNDRFGHAAGDHVLCEVAHILREETRAGDLVARVGGDEFVVICRDCDDPRTLARLAGRILARLRRPIIFAGQECRVGVSIGATMSRDYDPPGLSRMLTDADRALYAAKAAGRGGFRLFTPRAGEAAAPAQSRLPNSRK